MSIKLDNAKTGRTDKITKGVSTDFFETNAAHARNASPRAPAAVFSKGKK